MDKPSQIPVLANKRASMSLAPGVLQQSTNTVNGQARSPSPMLTKNGKRLSLLNGSMNSNGSGRRRSSNDPEDPVQLKAHISKLESALQAAHARMAEDCRGVGIDASMALSTPLSGSPLPWTPTHGTLDLPEMDYTPGMDESLDEVPEEPLKRLPKSNSNYDLRTAAATPRDQRGISQIPRAAVQNAVSLHPSPKVPSPLTSPMADSPGSNGNGQFSPSLHPSGLRKVSSSASAASTRVIDGLQTELLNTKGHLERVKQEVRGCQRHIGSLTRQNEDLKETKERLKQEIGSRENTLLRKERMLQEVLDRAQKAEAEVLAFTTNQKELEQTTKKTLSEMKAQLEEAQRKEAKATSECSALRNGVNGIKESFARDLKSIRTDMSGADERWKKEGEEMRAKNEALIALVKSQSAERTSIMTLIDKSTEQHETARKLLEDQVSGLRAQVDTSADETRRANEIAEGLHTELTRLRRFMREPRKSLDLDVTDTANVANDHAQSQSA